MQQQTKNMTCEKCGHDELAFVSVAHSERSPSIFFIIIILLCIGSGLFTWHCITTLIEIINETHELGTQIITVNILSTTIQILISIISLIIMLIAFFKLTPYKNKNAIHYVCKSCGHTKLIDQED